MDEFELIRRHFARATVPRRDVVLGIGDDGAVLALPGAGSQLVLVNDTIVDGVHFPRGTPPACVGHRALAVNLSDVAAMGAAPAWALLAITLPQVNDAWLEGFAEGLHALAAAFGVALVGGDTTAGETLTVTVTVAGLVPSGEALRRDGARPGDLVAVTGSPGDAGAGLALLTAGEREGGPGGADAPGRPDHEMRLMQRFLRPAPRVVEGSRLRTRATAAIDLSDGLLADAGKLAAASGVRLEIDADRLPLSPALLAYAGREAAERHALTGGDDYELLFTLAPAAADWLARLAAECGTAFTPIGRVCGVPADEAPGALALREGRPLELDGAGYKHFA